MVKGIVAVDSNYAIGRAGRLPWHYPEDMRHFRETTIGHAVVMGRRTFESIGRPLPGRINIVLSRTDLSVPSVHVARTPEEALVFPLLPGQDLFVIGGASVYRVMAPWIDVWIVTRIPGTHPDADTFLDSDLFRDFSLSSEKALGPLRVETWIRKTSFGR